MTKKIKIIDLLNKIANGEGVPKCFKYHNIIWEYDFVDYNYYNESDISFEEWFDDLMFSLNDDIEILDEDEFEDIKEIGIDETSNLDIAESFDFIEEKLNQLIKNQKKIIEKLKEE